MMKTVKFVLSFVQAQKIHNNCICIALILDHYIVQYGEFVVIVLPSYNLFDLKQTKVNLGRFREFTYISLHMMSNH